MLKITGENSINKSAYRQKKTMSRPNFGHHVLTTDNKGEKIYTINLPNAPKGAEIELMPFYYNENGNIEKVLDNPVKKSMPEGFSSITITKEDLPLSKDNLLGYRFRVNGKIYHDYTLLNGVKIGNPEYQYNIATPVNHSAHLLPRQMVHIFPDSFNVKPDKFLTKEGKQAPVSDMQISEQNEKIRRTPFNHLGGTIPGIREKLPKLKEFGANGVISCPITGNNNVSSHGYWTENPYQVTENLGTLKDFKELMLDIYKMGMHWVNDGAYVNEGLQGIHISDIVTWRDKSPFVYQFETKNLENEKLAMGIRPRSKELDKNVKIAVINGPYKVNFKENATGGFDDTGMVKNENFDPTKPTFVQVFNDEMVTEQQILSEKPFNVYGKKLADNKRKYYEKKDTIPAMFFRVSPTEVERNYKKYKNIKIGTPKDFLTIWKNYEIVPSNKDGGIALWVGNTDIAKKRFMFPESALNADEIAGNPEKIAKMIAGQYQTQDDVIQVAKYLTNEVQRTLVEYTADEVAKKVSDVKSEKDALVSLIWDNKISGDTENKLKSLAFENAVNEMDAENLLKKDELAPLIKEKTKSGKDYKTAVEELIWEEKISKNQADKLYEKITDGDAFENAVQTFIKENKFSEDQIKEIKSLTGTPVSYEDALKELIWENKIPQAAAAAFEKNGKEPSALENLLEFGADGNRKYKLSAAVMPENITDGVMSLPLEAIEFAPDLTTVLAYPYIKNLAVSDDYVGKSRYEMYKDGDKYYSKMPEDYRRVYEKADKIFAGVMTVKAKEIMQLLDDEDKFDGTLLDENGELTQDGREVYAIIAPDIVKYLVVSALAPDMIFDSKDKFFGYPVDKLKEVSLESLNLQFERSPEATADKLLDKLDSGLRNISEKKRAYIVEHLYNRLKNLDSDAINVAKLVIEKTESGLDWRIDASKDVGDWDSVQRNLMSPDECMKKVIKFWGRFNEGINKYNPKKYSIGELTNDIPSNWDWGTKEAEFVGKGGFTTQSNYRYLYSNPYRAFTMVTEPGDEYKQRNDNMDNLVQQILYNKDNDVPYLFSGFLDNVNFSHLFVGNHDKPRILHMLAIDDVYRFKDNKAEVMKNTLLNEGHLQDCAALPNECRAALRDAVIRLASGIATSKNGEKIYYDAENFGSTPFDVNIDDVIEEAKHSSKAFKEHLEKHPEDEKKIKISAFKDIIVPAIDVYKAMLFMHTVMPGTPTNYIGDEMGETGWETKAKNEKQANRNRIHWEWLTDKDYDWLKAKRRECADIFNIRNQPGASALVNGSTVPLAPLTHNATNGTNMAAAFYRYNDKTDAVCVLHNSGYNAQPDRSDKTRYVDCISLEQHGAAPYGLPSGLPAGTEYYNALNPSERFVVADNGREIVKKGGEKICIGAYGLALLRVYDFNGNNMLEKRKDVSFKGLNPHVTLANLKYNIPPAKI